MRSATSRVPERSRNSRWLRRIRLPRAAAALSLLARLAWHDGAARTATEHAEEALIEAGSDSPLQGEIRAQLVRFNFSFDLDRALDHASAAAAVLDEPRDLDVDGQPSVLVDIHLVPLRPDR